MMANIRRFILCLLGLLALVSPAGGAESYYLDLSAGPVVRIMGSHAFAIVRPEAAWDRKYLEQTKTKVLAWLEVEKAPKEAVQLKELLAKGFAGVVISGADPSVFRKLHAEFPQAILWVAGNYDVTAELAGLAVDFCKSANFSSFL